MPNNSDMSKFLYHIVKQLDLKSIDWSKVSSELGITNGHAARMRYSRFKQQMEGRTPGPRPPKKATAEKRAKKQAAKAEGAKAVPASIKTEDGFISSPPAATPEGSQLNVAQTSPEITVVKTEPREDTTGPEMPHGLSPVDYNRRSLSMQRLDLHSPGNMPDSINPGSLSCETVVPFPFEDQHPQIPHSQTMYQAMMPEVHEMMNQTLVADLAATEQRAFEQREYESRGYDHLDAVPRSDYTSFVDMNMYNHGGQDLGACHGLGHNQMIAPMVKVEERWDSSYTQC